MKLSAFVIVIALAVVGLVSATNYTAPNITISSSLIIAHSNPTSDPVAIYINGDYKVGSKFGTVVYNISNLTPTSYVIAAEDTETGVNDIIFYQVTQTTTTEPITTISYNASTMPLYTAPINLTPSSAVVITPDNPEVNASSFSVASLLYSYKVVFYGWGIGIEELLILLIFVSMVYTLLVVKNNKITNILLFSMIIIFVGGMVV